MGRSHQCHGCAGNERPRELTAEEKGVRHTDVPGPLVRWSGIARVEQHGLGDGGKAEPLHEPERDKGKRHGCP